MTPSSPQNPSERPPRMPRWTLYLFVIMLIGWGVALTLPVPPKAAEAIGDESTRFYFAKTLHVGIYAFFAFFAMLLPVRPPFRVMAVFTVSLHGFLTEYLQYAMNVGRTGKWTDVALDNLGVVFGVMISGFWLSFLGGRKR